MSQGEQIAGVLERELAAYDRLCEACPFSKPGKGPPSSKPCPKCGAPASETCRIAGPAAFNFVSAMRVVARSAS